MKYHVPFVDPRAHYSRLKPAIDEAIIGCLSSGDLIMRQQLRTFEENLAAFVGTKHAVGVNSGYHALHLALLGAGVKPGDEVITAAHTFVATVSAIVHAGATPVLVDVTGDHTLDPNAVERAITDRTRALLPVHLNGRMADMSSLKRIADKYDVPIIEDAAQALGASCGVERAGSAGLAGCFSFYPFKILGGFGDGGAITTNDDKLARTARLLRYNGEDRQTGEYHYHGYTVLLDNVQAAVLDIKLRHLPSWIEHRRNIARRYDQALRGVGDLKLPSFDDHVCHHVFQNYVIETAHRDALKDHLARHGIETLVHWPKPLWRHPGLALPTYRLPCTESLCQRVLSLPMSAETTVEHVDHTAAATHAFFLQF